MGHLARELPVSEKKLGSEREQMLRPLSPLRTLAVENPLADRKMQLPWDVRVKDGRILWTMGDIVSSDRRDGRGADGSHSQSDVPIPEEACLWAFIRLADEQSEEKFLSFAREYGVLGLCPLPEDEQGRGRGRYFSFEGHVQCWYPGAAYGRFSAVKNSNTRELWLWEPIEGWKRFAQEAKAILNIAAALRMGIPARSRDWKALYGRSQEGPDTPEPEAAEPIGIQRKMIAGVISNRWLDCARVTLVYHWSADDPPRIHLANLHWPLNSLFNTLALQLASAVSADERLVQCASCGNAFSYQKKRHPRADQPHYCSIACDHEAQKEDQREYQARRRAEKKRAALLSS